MLSNQLKNVLELTFCLIIILLFVVKIKLQRKTHRNTSTLEMNKLKSNEIEKQSKTKIQNKINNICSENLKTNDVNIKLKNIQCAILTESRQDLKPERIKKKEWMIENILNFMKERRRYKNAK